MDDMDDNAEGELIDAATDAALEAMARSLNLNVDSMTEPEHFDGAYDSADECNAAQDESTASAEQETDAPRQSGTTKNTQRSATSFPMRCQ